MSDEFVMIVDERMYDCIRRSVIIAWCWFSSKINECIWSEAINVERQRTKRKVICNSLCFAATTSITKRIFFISMRICWFFFLSLNSQLGLFVKIGSDISCISLVSSRDEKNGALLIITVLFVLFASSSLNSFIEKSYARALFTVTASASPSTPFVSVCVQFCSWIITDETKQRYLIMALVLVFRFFFLSSVSSQYRNMKLRRKNVFTPSIIYVICTNIVDTRNCSNLTTLLYSLACFVQ